MMLILAYFIGLCLECVKLLVEIMFWAENVIRNDRS